MSRSNKQEGSQNPAKMWFEWSGATGQIKYFDKNKNENLFLPLPFNFLVLDQLSTLTGYHDEKQSGIWANEVRNVRIEPFIVRTKEGIYGKGTYDMVKNLKGVRYTKSIYIAYYDENKELQIGNLKAVGSSLSAWIEFTKGKDVYENAVSITKAVQAKKGATKYFVPVFEVKSPVSEETNALALELDKELQAYLTDYLARNAEENHIEPDEVFRTQGAVKSDVWAATAGNQAVDAVDHDEQDDEEIPF